MILNISSSIWDKNGTSWVIEFSQAAKYVEIRTDPGGKYKIVNIIRVFDMNNQTKMCKMVYIIKMIHIKSD